MRERNKSINIRVTEEEKKKLFYGVLQVVIRPFRHLL